MDFELGITKENYHSRNTIFGWDFTGTQTEPGVAFEHTENQKLGLNIKLTESKDYTICLIVYGEWEQEMEITPTNKVVMYRNGYSVSSS